MKSYTVKRIAAELNIDRETASLIRRIVRGEVKCGEIYRAMPAVWKWRQSLYNAPRVCDVRMEAINALMGGFGVEGYEHADSHGCGRYEDYTDYVNTGDTYNPTVAYFGGRFIITDLEDLNSRIERAHAA